MTVLLSLLLTACTEQDYGLFPLNSEDTAVLQETDTGEIDPQEPFPSHLFQACPNQDESICDYSYPTPLSEHCKTEVRDTRELFDSYTHQLQDNTQPGRHGLTVVAHCRWDEVGLYSAPGRLDTSELMFLPGNQTTEINDWIESTDISVFERLSMFDSSSSLYCISERALNEDGYGWTKSRNQIFNERKPKQREIVATIDKTVYDYADDEQTDFISIYSQQPSHDYYSYFDGDENEISYATFTIEESMSDLEISAAELCGLNAMNTSDEYDVYSVYYFPPEEN